MQLRLAELASGQYASFDTFYVSSSLPSKQSDFVEIAKTPEAGPTSRPAAERLLPIMKLSSVSLSYHHLASCVLGCQMS